MDQKSVSPWCRSNSWTASKSVPGMLTHTRGAFVTLLVYLSGILSPPTLPFWFKKNVDIPVVFPAWFCSWHSYYFAKPNTECSVSFQFPFQHVFQLSSLFSPQLSDHFIPLSESSSILLMALATACQPLAPCSRIKWCLKTQTWQEQ